MTNYREILRLHSLGLNNTEIAHSCPCSCTTVIQVLRLAQANNLTYPLPYRMTDKELAELLYSRTEGKPENAGLRICAQGTAEQWSDIESVMA